MSPRGKHLAARSGAAVVTAVLGVTLPLAPAASAAEGHEVRFFDGGTPSGGGAGEPWISFDRLLPGDRVTADLALVNASEDAATVTMQVTGLRDREVDCLEPEEAAGDRTCGTGPGELSQALRIDLERTVDGSRETIWSGTAADLRGRTPLGRLAGGGRWPITATVTLPDDAGNETMTDEVAFDVTWSARTAGGRSDDEVLGVEAGAGGKKRDGTAVAGVEGEALPATGAHFPRWLATFGASALGAGLVLMVAGRRRRVGA